MEHNHIWWQINSQAYLVWWTQYEGCASSSLASGTSRLSCLMGSLTGQAAVVCPRFRFPVIHLASVLLGGFIGPLACQVHQPLRTGGLSVRGYFKADFIHIHSWGFTILTKAQAGWGAICTLSSEGYISSCGIKIFCKPLGNSILFWTCKTKTKQTKVIQTEN